MDFTFYFFSNFGLCCCFVSKEGFVDYSAIGDENH